METKNKVVATFGWDYIEHDVFDILSKNHPEYHGEIDWDWIFGHLNDHANDPLYLFFKEDAIRESLESLIEASIEIEEKKNS